MMHNKMTRLKQIAYMCLLVLFANTFLCGANDVFELDTENTPVYQSIDTDKVFRDFSNDSKTAKKSYDENFYLLYGKVLSKNKNNKEITVGAINSNSENEVKCKFSDKADINYVSGLSVGNTVRMYGKLSVGITSSLSFKAKGIAKVETVNFTDDSYSVWGGNVIKKSSMSKKTIEGSSVVYYVPQEWTSVEHDIKVENLGSISGYQYSLNNLGKKDTYEECFFVCYFDKKTGVEKKNIGEDKLIEEAILGDILGQLKKKFPAKTIKTYYGPKYKYYRDIFKRSTGEKYQVETVFQEKGDGIIVYLYLYHKEAKHVGDIMVVMRLLES